MAVAGAPEQLVDLLRAVARMPGGEIAPTAQSVGRRVGPPPAKQTLADRRRQASTQISGGPNAPPGTRKC
jgi:hypothetical protein